MNRILYLMAFLSLTGCSTPSYNYTQADYKSTPLSFPKIGELNEVPVGEVMLEQGMVVEKDVLIIKNDLVITKHILIKAGDYQKTGMEGDVGSFLGNNGFLPNGGVVLVRGAIEPLNYVSFNIKTNKICVANMLSAPRCVINPDASLGKKKIMGKDSFQQTLIYSGKAGSKVNVDYREFSSNVARPAFAAKAEYDLNESKVIGYKGALIEVVEANNQSIKYKVVKNFNAAN